MLAPSSPEDFLRSIDDAKIERRRQKDAERSLETRVLEPWERYHALVDHYDAVQDVSEQNDRKARFALLILGSLNALNLAIAMRGEWIGVKVESSTVVMAYLAAYALVSLACCFCAVAALRPHTREGDESGWSKPLLPHATAAQTLDEYRDNWRTAEIGALIREMDSLVYGAVRNNEGKLQSLHRVYVALYLLVALTGGFVCAQALSALLPN